MIELGLFACMFATLFGFVRIFGNHANLGRLTIVAAASSLLAAVLRRRGTGILVSAGIHVVVGIVIIANVYLPDTVAYGIPTADTFTSAYSSMTADLPLLQTAVPPITASTGLLLVLALIAWFVPLFADSAALRIQATVQAVLPMVVTFIAVGISHPGFDRLLAIVVFAAAIGFYVVAVQYTRNRSLRWAGSLDDARRGLVRLTSAGVIMCLVVGVAGTAVSIIEPPMDPVFTLRYRAGTDGREVVSPFVSIRSLLGNRSETPMFQVTADTVGYWRLTALDTYDEAKDIWVSSGQYNKPGRTLARTTDPAVETTDSDQHFEVLSMGGPWIPAMFEPEQYRSGPGASFNAATATLFADEDLSHGQSYDIGSVVPLFTPQDLTKSRMPTSEDVDENLLVVPVESAVQREFLDDVVDIGDPLYDQLLALQNTFRSAFTYSEDVDYSDSDDPIEAFLIDRAGFCQQFSSVFAVMARRLGLPSRVAVGFTMGEPVEDAEDDSPTRDDPDGAQTYLVRGMHAHAWPEVYFQDVGWVAFEPTPGRGNPLTESYTGIAAAQAEPETPVPETVPTTVPVDDPATTSTPDGSVPPTSTPGRAEGSDDGVGVDESTAGSTVPRFIGLAAIIIAAGAIIVVRRRRRLQTESDDVPDEDPDERSLLTAWESAVLAIADLGLSLRPSETPLEFASRVSRHIGVTEVPSTDPVVLVARDLSTLAAIETQRRYSSLFDATGNRDQGLITELVAESERSSATITSWIHELGRDGVAAMRSDPAEIEQPV